MRALATEGIFEEVDPGEFALERRRDACHNIRFPHCCYNCTPARRKMAGAEGICCDYAH